MHVLASDLHLRELVVPGGRKLRNHRLHELLRRRGAGSQPDRGVPLQQVAVEASDSGTRTTCSVLIVNA